MARAVDILHDLPAKWTLDSLARKVGSNRTDLEIGFKSLTGHTVHQYVTHVRIDAAKKMLRSRAWSCAAIARAIGYSSTSSFHSNFNRQVGITPDEYRRRWIFVRVNGRVIELIKSGGFRKV